MGMGGCAKGRVIHIRWYSSQEVEFHSKLYNTVGELRGQMVF
jgi:hypothetical protein